MRPRPFTLSCSLLATATALASSALVTAELEIRDAATNEQLTEQFRKSSRINPLAKLDPRITKEDAPADPTKHNKPKDLIATSDFLSFGGLSTLIPKRALLNVPKQYKDRIVFVKGTKLVIWPQFFQSNRGWIKTMEVTRGQAQGKEPFDEKVLENLQKTTIVVVATYKGGPISVLPYVDPEAVEETTEEKPKDKE